MSDVIATRYARFAEVEARDSSPLYAQLAAGVAADPEVIALLGTLPEAKQQPNLLFAAARFVAGTPEGFADFRSTVCDRWADVSAIMRTKRTQTNEPARCAAFYPLLASFRQPLALIEVGASAGLCLYPDRYRYEYRHDGTTTISGDPTSPLTIGCDVIGDGPAVDKPIDVVWRAGIDLNPLDVNSDDDMGWLETLIWPGEPMPASGLDSTGTEGSAVREARLRAAVAIARTDPPRIVAGDLLGEFAALAAQAPADATLVVFHSAVLTYVPVEIREAFADLALATRGHWLSQEAPHVVARATPADETVARNNFVMACDAVPVAVTAPHGGAIRWLLPEFG